MSRVRGKNTKPEIIVRSVVHRLGFRFRLHKSDLPGKPDIVLSKHKKVIFVNGCFWHGHTCPRATKPTSNLEFWRKKLDGNAARDKKNVIALESLGWKVLTIWSCEIKNEAKFKKKIIKFLKK